LDKFTFAKAGACARKSGEWIPAGVYPVSLDSRWSLPLWIPATCSPLSRGQVSWGQVSRGQVSWGQVYPCGSRGGNDKRGGNDRRGGNDNCNWEWQTQSL